MLNKLTIIGRLGQDPELKMTPSGTAVCTVGVATTEKWKDKTGEEKKETQWHNIVMWGKNAENAEKYMKKGQLHYFEGTMKYEKYTKDGVDKIAPKMHLTRFILLPQGQGQTGSHVPDDSNLPPGYTGGGRGDDETDMSEPLPPSSSSGKPYDDDIPF